MKLFTCGTTALFAAALTLQAQTSGAGTSGASAGSTAGSSATSNTGASAQTMPSSSPQSTSQFGTSTAPSSGSTATAPQSSGSQFGSSSANATSSTQIGTAPSNPSTPTGAQSGFSTSTPSTYGSQSFNAAGSANTSANMNSSTNINSSATNATNSTMQSTTAAAGGFTTVSDSQVTTFVQQYDALAPDVVVQRVSSDLGDLACSQDTVQNLVEALHSGRSVTITSNVNGQPQSATFNPEGVHMGYGEAYITLAMAAQELRDAGVSTCASPEQWNAVLMGGPLNVTSTSTTYNSSASASGSRQVQGIVTLRQQGQGWGQIAQANNVQLGQVINGSATSQTGAQSGFSDSQAEQGNVNATGTVEDHGNHKSHKKHWWNRDKDNKKDSSSTHADDSAKPDNK